MCTVLLPPGVNPIAVKKKKYHNLVPIYATHFCENICVTKLNVDLHLFACIIIVKFYILLQVLFIFFNVAHTVIYVCKLICTGYSTQWWVHCKVQYSPNCTSIMTQVHTRVYMHTSAV